MRHHVFIGLLIAVLGVVALARPAGAIVIQFEAIDLPDVPAGDLWQYQYTVSDVVFQADQNFTIEFPVGLYRDLEDPAPVVNADWDVLVLQPDPNIPDAGIYDALALVDGPSLADTFDLSFVWLGAGQPGAQRFTVNQFDAAGNFIAELASGVTVPLATPVPAPGPLGLVTLGFGALGLARSFRRR